MRCTHLFFFAILGLTCCVLERASAFPKGRPLAFKTRFSRESVKLQGSNKKNGNALEKSPLISRQALIKFDVLVGILYSTSFFLFPGETLSLFFNYDFDTSIQRFLHMAVRMIAINHVGYVSGLLAAPPEKAIRVATAFLTIGGAFVVYYGQAKLDTAVAFWSCTILTTVMLLAHLLAL